MAYPAILLCHSCQVETGETTGSKDAWQVPSATKTFTTVSCRFFATKGSLKQLEPGELVVRGQGVILPAGTTVSEGKQIVGLSPGYTETYRVIGTPRQAMVQNEISHIVCDLEVVT